MFATNGKFGDLGICPKGLASRRGLGEYLSVSFLFVFQIRFIVSAGRLACLPHIEIKPDYFAV